MSDKILLLISNIKRDLIAIETIYQELETHPFGQEASKDTLIIIAYHLHNLYNAFENIFLNIARTFENSIDDKTQWHAELLERMTLSINLLRPAVIDETAYDALDELRRFRHLFRHAYMVKLDPMRLQLVIHKANQLRTIYPNQVELFLSFLNRLE
ncbi:hypothetical protein QUF58_06385 [Anaerolineales bacterium HSG24]|nr:hypothetical protein [Anaerolineales bacterium HSG24]